MFEDILGEKKTNEWIWKPLEFKVDTPSRTGKIYPKEIFIKAFQRCLSLGNIFLVNCLPQDPSKVDLIYVIGECKEIQIAVDNKIYVKIRYFSKDFEDVYKDFPIWIVALGSMLQNIIQDDLIITALYLDMEPTK